MAEQEKIFLNGIFVRERKFDNGGSILKCDILDANDFASQLKSFADDKGKITLEIKERKNKAENGISHYVEVSQFVPTNQNQNSNQKSETSKISFNDLDF